MKIWRDLESFKYPRVVKIYTHFHNAGQRISNKHTEKLLIKFLRRGKDFLKFIFDFILLKCS